MIIYFVYKELRKTKEHLPYKQRIRGIECGKWSYYALCWVVCRKFRHTTSACTGRYSPLSSKMRKFCDYFLVLSYFIYSILLILCSTRLGQLVSRQLIKHISDYHTQSFIVQIVYFTFTKCSFYNYKMFIFTCGGSDLFWNNKEHHHIFYKFTLKM